MVSMSRILYGLLESQASIQAKIPSSIADIVEAPEEKEATIFSLP